MRIRSIKPEFWRSDDIAALPISARLLFIGLWSYVDDNGVGSDRLPSIVADLFANDLVEDTAETLRRVNADLTQIQNAGLIERYEANGKPLLYITNWKKHQLVRNPSKGNEYPLPPGVLENPTDSGADPAQSLRRPSALEGEQGRGNRGAEEQGSGGDAFAAPTPTCKKHSHWRHEDKCGPCGRDRRAFEEWEVAEAKRPKPQQPHKHKWLSDGTCNTCEAREENET